MHLSIIALVERICLLSLFALTALIGNMSVLISLNSVILAVAILFLYASWSLYKKRRSFRHITSKIPTRYGIPFIGIAYEFLDLTKVYKNASRGFDKIKSLTACVWVANTPIVITIDPEVIKHVTTSPEFLNKARDLYAHFHNGVINGLIVNPVKKWKPDRKAITPFLSHNNILSFFPFFNDNAKNVLRKLTDLAGHGEKDVYGIIKAMGLQLSILTIMGIKIEEGTQKYNEIMNAFNILVHRMADNSVYSSVGLGFLTLTPTYNRTIKYLRELVRSLIKETLARQSDEDKFEDGRQTVIDLMLRVMRQGHFTPNDVEIESFTMIAASYETSAFAVYSTIVMLAMHPEIQERAFQEVYSVYPDKITSVEYDELKNLPYLDMVIAESLRLNPPIPYIGRQTINETELWPGLTLPKEMQVIIPIYELHRRKELWGPEAARFNPENFLPENIAKRHPCTYMAFSKGPRNCIGFRYADVTLRVLLITLLRSLKFSTTFRYEDIVFMPRVTLSYEKEPLVSIELRDC